MNITNETPTLQDLFKTFKQRFLSIRIQEPNRANCNWYVGLTDDENKFLNSFECNSTGDAETLVEFILSNQYTNLTRGEDYGNAAFRKIVYLYSEDK